jgi:hypothetical protein
VAFIINVTDSAVAHEMLEKLPLAEDHAASGSCGILRSRT